MSKKILILLGFLFLTIFFLGNISAVDVCWVEASSADCVNNNGKVVMSVSGATNAHGALAGQGTFIPVLCCNFGEGDTTCIADNKIIGLSSSTNAHAEIPDLVSPNYNVNVCYDSLRNCRETDVSCGINEIEVLYISNIINAHIEAAGLQSQNYDSKICCVIELLMACYITSAEWQYEEVMDGTDTGVIVNGTGCSGVEISFEVFRGSTSCDSIDGCENPSNVVFAAGSNSVAGTWSAGPYHDNEYYLVVKVVANPDETVTSSEPNLLVIAECPYDPEPVICGDYTNVNACNSNICEIDVQDSVPSYVDCSDPDIDCWCIWENDECKVGWESEIPPDSHTECIDNMCVKVDGVGVSECSPVGSSCNIIDPNYNVCLGPACVLELGEGEDQCTGPEQCVGEPEWHSICESNACVQVEGPGVIACLPIGPESSGCPTPLETYSMCVGQMCVLKVGLGESQCEKSADCAEDGLPVGTCIYTQSIDGNCDTDEFLTILWTAQWTWNEDVCDATCQAENQELAAQCETIQETRVCPAQIPLPFFNIYSFVAALTIIALIYVILILRKEKRKR